MENSLLGRERFRARASRKRSRIEIGHKAQVLGAARVQSLKLLGCCPVT